METGNKNNNYISFAPKTNNSTSEQHHQQNLQGSKKTQPLKTYTFYHSTRTHSNERLSFNQLPNKQYRFTSELTQQPRRKTLSQSSSGYLNYSIQQTKIKSPEVTHFNTENAFKKSIHVPQVSCFKPDLVASQSYVKERSSIRYGMDKSQSSQSQRRTISTEMIESKIITKKSEIEEQNRNFNISSEKLQQKVQAHLVTKYSNIQEEFSVLREKFQIIEAENKVLERRNLDLVQQMLSSESIIRELEEKEKKYDQSTKKYEDSIKISRNIITSLNEKIARIQKQNEVNCKNLQDNYQEKLLVLENSKNEALKISEAQIFELKLKIIDQNHQLQEKLENEKILQSEETLNKLKQDLSQKDQKVNTLQLQIVKLNDFISRLDSDLLKLDQENIRLDQENNRLATINSQLLQYKPAIENLTIENETFKQELQNLSKINIQKSASIRNLEAEKQVLMNQILKCKEQVQIQMQEVRKLTQVITIERKEKQFRATKIEGLQLQLKRYLQKSEEKPVESQQNRILKQQLQIIKGIGHQLQQKLQSSLRDNQILHGEKAILKEQISDGKIFTDSLLKKYQEKKEQVNNLEESIENKDTLISQLNINLLNLQLQILDLKERIRKNQMNSQLPSQNEPAPQNSFDAHAQCQIQIKGLQDKIDQLTQKISEAQNTVVLLQDKVKAKGQGSGKEQVSSQLQQLQLYSQLQQLQLQLQSKDKQIQNLHRSLLSRQNQIIDLNLKVDSVLDEKTQGTIQIDKTKQLEVTISDLKEQLQMQIIQDQLLQSELTIIKQQNQELSKEIKFMEQAKQLQNNQINRVVLDLKQQVTIAQEREQNIHKELEELKQLLKRQQQEYLITLDQQIKKITMIEEEDDLQKQQHQKNSQLYQEQASLGEALQEFKDQNIRDQYGNTQMFEAWMQNITEYSREQLISKIQELIFVNKSLNMKVNDLNEMQQNSNDMIMNKINVFQDVIEKYQLQITELQEQNQVLKNQVKQLTERCHFLEGKIEWMDTIYKEVEANLLQTNEELLRVQVQYINLKLSQETQDIDQKQAQPQQNQEIIEPNQHQSKNFESSISEDQAPGAIQQKETAIQELKDINLALQEEIQKVRSSQASQKQATPVKVNKIEEEERFLQDQRRQERELQRFMEGEYYIKQSQVGGVTYSIVVSHIDSEDEEYLEESPSKAEDEAIIDKMIEEYQDQSSGQHQVPFYAQTQNEETVVSIVLHQKLEKIQTGKKEQVQEGNKEQEQVGQKEQEKIVVLTVQEVQLKQDNGLPDVQSKSVPEQKQNKISSEEDKND